MRLLAVLFILCASPYSYAAKKCGGLFPSKNTASSLITSLLEPLRIDYLIQQVDYRLNHDPRSVDPSLDKMVYTRDDGALFADKSFPLDIVKPHERIIETDYGYAVMDVHTLRDWTLLADIIKNPEAAKKFIDEVANTEGLFPGGITRESAEWLRWSIVAKKLAESKVENDFNKKFEKNPEAVDKILSEWAEVDLKIRTEFRRLVRQKEIFIFPFGTDGRGLPNEMRPDNAQVVLEVLARYQLISNLYVKRPDNQYRLLSEFLDRDSLMLVSRFPELLPAYPVFEGGHISFPHGDTRIAYNDSFNLGTSKISENRVNDEVSYVHKFYAAAEGDGLWGGPVRDIYGLFLIDFKSNKEGVDPDYKDISEKTFETIFKEELQKAQAFMERKTEEFTEITGYPIKARVKEFTDSPFDGREFEILFSSDIPPHIKAAFFVFAGLD